MKITPLQQYLFLGVFVLLLLGYVYYQFLLKPLNNNIESLRSTLTEQKAELEKARRIAEKYVEFKKRADSVQRELEWLQNRIPKTIDQSKLVETLNLIQNNSGVVFTGFQFQSPTNTQNAPYIEVPVSVSFNSSYKGLLNFLYQIETSNLFMTVRELSVVPASDANHQEVTLSARMTVSGIQAK